MSSSFPVSVSKDIMADDMGAVRFWVLQQNKFPQLLEVALRVYAAPASSTSSKRNFSTVYRIFSETDRVWGQISSKI